MPKENIPMGIWFHFFFFLQQIITNMDTFFQNVSPTLAKNTEKLIIYIYTHPHGGWAL